MKRIIPLLTAAMLAVLPAQAETWFPDVSGTLIHRDPFCAERIFSLESFYLPALQVSPNEIISTGYFAPTREHAAKEIVTADASYAVCPHCDAPSVEIPESTELYYNPAGGTRLHRDPECPSVSRKYLPLKNITDATGAIPQTHCTFCGPRFMLSPADTLAWNATIDEKALMLPGVWTLPSEEAISPEEAADIARAWAVKHLPGDEYTVCPMHYDYGTDVSDTVETYKVLVSTALQQPVCVLYLDALNGAVYAVHRAAEFLCAW